MIDSMVPGSALKADANGEVIGPSHYYTQNDLPAPHDSLVYSNIVDDFKWNENRTALVKVGSHDRDKEIQVASVGITPYDILERTQADFSKSAFHATEGVYADVSGMPETLADEKIILDNVEALKEAQYVPNSGQGQANDRGDTAPVLGVSPVAPGGVGEKAEKVEVEKQADEEIGGK
jgi:hypothetical protein